MNRLVQPLCDLVPQAIAWLWPNNLSLGNLALFDGDPGLGKSLAALELCARLTTGRPFPGAAHAVEPAPAIVLSAEDGPLTTVLPRLQALGADLSRVHVLRCDFMDAHGGFYLPKHIGVLDRALADTRARLLVIDPITSFLDKKVNIGSDVSVRTMLRPLIKLAGRHRCVPILIRHLNKTAGRPSIYRGGGSIAFQGLCRSSWLFGRHPLREGQCVMAQVKNNYAPIQPALTYAVRTDGRGSILEWCGTTKLTANHLLAAAGRKPDLPAPSERAAEFLLDFLHDEPRPTTDIWPAAQEVGLTRSTLRRARKSKDIRVVRAWAGARLLSYWLLPGQNLPANLRGDTLPDVQKLLKPLIEKYPTTPIDPA